MARVRRDRTGANSLVADAGKLRAPVAAGDGFGGAGGDRPRHSSGRRRLLWPQRRRRRSARCRLIVSRARPAGQGGLVARGRAGQRSLRSRHDDGPLGRARRRRRDRRLEISSLQPTASFAAGLGRGCRPIGRVASCRAVCAAGGGEPVAGAGRRRRSQRGAPLCLPQPVGDPPFHPARAAAQLRAARARRVRQRVLDRVLHGRARRGVQCRPTSIPAAPPHGRASARDAGAGDGGCQRRADGSRRRRGARTRPRLLPLQEQRGLLRGGGGGPGRRARARRAGLGRRRCGAGGQSRRPAEPDRGRNRPGGQLDADRGSQMGREPGPDSRLGELSDPFLLRGACDRGGAARR